MNRSTIMYTSSSVKLPSGDIATVKVNERTWSGCDNSATKYHAATRVYVWADTDVEFPDYDGNEENNWTTSPEYDKAMRKANKQYIDALRPFADFGVDLAKMANDVTTPPEFALSFSRTAGCSCGCSPAFVVKVRDTMTNRLLGASLRRNGAPVDVSVSIKAAS